MSVGEKLKKHFFFFCWCGSRQRHLGRVARRLRGRIFPPRQLERGVIGKPCGPKRSRSRLRINGITFGEGCSIPGAPYPISPNVINARMCSDKRQKNVAGELVPPVSKYPRSLASLARSALPVRPHPTGHIAFLICNMEHNYTNSSLLH